MSRFLRQHRLSRRVEPIVNCLQLPAAINPNAMVIEAGSRSPFQDSKVDPRVFERSFRVVRLKHARLRVKQS